MARITTGHIISKVPLPVREPKAPVADRAGTATKRANREARRQDRSLARQKLGRNGG